MSDGQAFGATCYRQPAELAAAACSSISGTTSEGVVSCSAPAVTGNVLSYTLSIHASSGTVTRAVTVDLQPCEPYDAEFWQPVLAAWFSAMVGVLCLRLVFVKVFNRDSSL